MINRVNTKSINNKQIQALIIISAFYVMFFPTSLSGSIVGNMWAIRNLSACLIAAYLMIKNKLLVRPWVVTAFLLVYLAILTCTTSILYNQGLNDFHVAWASLSGFLPTILIWCLSFKQNTVKCEWAHSLLNVLTGCILVWGWGLVFKNQFITDITRSFYSQLTDSMFDNMITIRGKPVMSFGTHSMAAFFIMIFFFYHCIAVKEGKANVLDYVSMALLYLLVIPLSSNTAMLALVVMLILFIWSKNNIFTRIIVGFAILIAAIYLYRQGVISEFVLSITDGVNASAHGFGSRYLSGIYANNFKIATTYVGVGFLRSDSGIFRMNDSGIIYLFTQGNVVALLLTYWLMFSFLKRNMVKYSRLTFAIFFIWEFISASTFISVKMIFAQILTIYIINSFCSNEERGDLFGSGQSSISAV